MKSNRDSRILAGLFGNISWIKVIGKGSVENSPTLQSYVQMLDPDYEIVVDLIECDGLDSTFMGTLASIADGRRDGKPRKICVVNAGDRNLALLRGLGLHHMFTIEHGNDSYAEQEAAVREELKEEEEKQVSERERTEIVLEAHEKLGEVDPGNVSRFKDVVKILRDSLGEEEE